MNRNGFLISPKLPDLLVPKPALRQIWKHIELRTDYIIDSLTYGKHEAQVGLAKCNPRAEGGDYYMVDRKIFFNLFEPA